jgi:hypothetical protein
VALIANEGYDLCFISAVSDDRGPTVTGDASPNVKLSDALGLSLDFLCLEFLIEELHAFISDHYPTAERKVQFEFHSIVTTYIVYKIVRVIILNPSSLIVSSFTDRSSFHSRSCTIPIPRKEDRHPQVRHLHLAIIMPLHHVRALCVL